MARGRSPRTAAAPYAVIGTICGLLVLGPVLFSLESCAAPGTATRPFVFSDSYGPGQQYMGIRLHGAIEILPTEVDGIPLVELSGLAWDDDAALLYALSDRGRLFHLRVQFRDGTLQSVNAVRVVTLRDANGEPLSGHAADSEGLAITGAHNGRAGDTQLLISFEHYPRIAAFDPEGRQLRVVALPETLQQETHYATPNKALEAVAMHPRFGILTGPEWPFSGQDPAYIPVFAPEHDIFWHYPRAAAPNSALVAMEALPDGSLLTLERSYQSLLLPVTIALRRTVPLQPEPNGQRLMTRDIAVFSSAEGWHVDNFEGLSRHRAGRYFMVSDDNARSLQRTVLVYFELIGSRK